MLKFIMQIYIEDIILMNALSYMCFLIIISQALKFKATKTRLILSSLFCGIFSLYYTLQNVDRIIQVIFELSLSLFAITNTYKNLTKKKILQAYIILIVSTNIYSGILSTYFKTYSNNGIIINSQIPLYITLLILITTSTLIRKTFDIITSKRKIYENVCTIELCYMGKSITTTGYLDSGNNLLYNSKPVSIINFDLFQKLTDISLADYLSKRWNLPNVDYIKANTITGSNKLLLFKIDKIKISNNNNVEIINSPNLAMSLKLLNKNYEIIINNYLINN